MLSMLWIRLLISAHNVIDVQGAILYFTKCTYQHAHGLKFLCAWWPSRMNTLLWSSWVTTWVTLCTWLSRTAKMHHTLIHAWHYILAIVNAQLRDVKSWWGVAVQDRHAALEQLGDNSSHGVHLAVWDGQNALHTNPRLALCCSHPQRPTLAMSSHGGSGCPWRWYETIYCMCVIDLLKDKCSSILTAKRGSKKIPDRPVCEMRKHW